MGTIQISLCFRLPPCHPLCPPTATPSASYLIASFPSLTSSFPLPQLIRLVLEAPGWAGRLCAPREMLVERMLKTEEGMHVVLFSSVEESTLSCAPVAPLTSPKPQQQAREGGQLR